MSCLRTAAELVSGANMMPDQKASLAISVAEKLEKHVLRGPVAVASEETAEKEQTKGEPQHGKEGKA